MPGKARYKMKEELSLHQRIHNANGSQEVENLKAIHAYTHGRNWPTEEWGYIWSTSDDCSWAHSFGRWRGFNLVYLNSVTEWDTTTLENYMQLYKLYPEVMGMDPRPLNFAAVHNLSSDVIEVAEDGGSARGAYLTPGTIFETLRPSQKRRAIFMWERYGADFVYEDGKWKYLHEQVCPDFQGNNDTANWGLEAYESAMNPRMMGGPGGPPPGGGAPGDGAPGGGPGGPGGAPGGNPNGAPPPGGGGGGGRDMMLSDPGPLHNEYSFFQTPQNTVPWPEPYKTLDNDNTYTPFI